MNEMKLTDLVPSDAQYDFDPTTGLATVQIETAATRPGKVVYAEVTARLRVNDHGILCAEYVSHEGEATKEDIDYALSVIETNDFGV